MSKTRREFLEIGAALAIGMAGDLPAAQAADAAAERQAQGSSAGAQGKAVQNPEAAGSRAEVQIPKMKFGQVEIGRLVLGVNPLYGFAHYNGNFGNAMRDWYTQDRVCEVMHRANSYGIDAFNYVQIGRAPQDWARFQAEGGKMQLIIQVTAMDDAAQLVRDLKPLALQRRGEEIDEAFQKGTLASERDWCKRARELGVLVGVGTHKPEVIELVEE